jgi:hypothetical protein
MRRAIYITATVAVLLVASRYAFTQGSQETKGKNPPASVVVPTSPVPAALASNRVLQRIYLFRGTGPSSIPASTWTAFDSPHTIQCPGTTGTCTITSDISLQVGQATTASNDTAVALAVDGTIVCTVDATGGCHYSIEAPQDGKFVEANELNQFSGVGLGNHIVQTFVWSDNGAVGGFYNVRVTVYKP